MTPVSVMKTGVEKTAQFGKAHAILTANNLIIAMVQRIVTVTTVLIMPNSTSATTVFA